MQTRFGTVQFICESDFEADEPFYIYDVVDSRIKVGVGSNRPKWAQLYKSHKGETYFMSGFNRIYIDNSIELEKIWD